MKICSKFQYVCTYVHKQPCKCLLVCPMSCLLSESLSWSKFILGCITFTVINNKYCNKYIYCITFTVLSSFCLSQLHLWAWFILHKIKSVSPNHLTQLVLITLWSPIAGTVEHSPPPFFLYLPMESHKNCFWPRIWLTSNWIRQKSYQIPIHSEMPVHLKWIIFVCVCLVTQSCLTLFDPLDCSLLGSFVHGILQVRILEGVIIPFSRGSSQPRDRTQISYIAGRFFTKWATR